MSNQRQVKLKVRRTVHLEYETEWPGDYPDLSLDDAYKWEKNNVSVIDAILAAADKVTERINVVIEDI